MGDVEMTHEQKIFYERVGRVLTAAMKNRSISIGEVARKSGEQHKTISAIMAGKNCSLHHAAWMRSVLGINLNEIASPMEGTYGKEEISNTTEGITGEERQVLNRFIDSIGRQHPSGQRETRKGSISDLI